MAALSVATCQTAGAPGSAPPRGAAISTLHPLEARAHVRRRVWQRLKSTRFGDSECGHRGQLQRWPAHRRASAGAECVQDHLAACGLHSNLRARQLGVTRASLAHSAGPGCITQANEMVRMRSKRAVECSRTPSEVSNRAQDCYPRIPSGRTIVSAALGHTRKTSTHPAARRTGSPPARKEHDGNRRREKAPEAALEQIASSTERIGMLLVGGTRRQRVIPMGSIA